MNESDHKPRGGMNFLSSLLGGLVVLVLGAVLIATGVIDTGDTKREVVTTGTTRAVNDAGTKPASPAAGRSVSDIYKDEGQGVVFVKSEGVKSPDSSKSPFGQPDGQGDTATGSGFVVGKDGTIVTNAHVVDGAKKVSVSFKEDTSDFVDAEVKGRDVSSDLAVLKVDPSKVKDLRVLPLGNSKGATVGDPVIAIGNPFGFTRTVTTGIVSAVQRTIEAPNNFSIADVIQTDAAINPGNSGGPLLDAQGNVIGINAQIATSGGSGSSSGGSVGIGFAIPVNTLKTLLPQLRQGGEIQRGFLGVSTTSVTSDVATELKLKTKSGALIQQVTAGGPADDAGLKAGKNPTSSGLIAGSDVIVAVDGKPVKASDELVAIISAKKPGDKVKLTYYRGSTRKTTEVTLKKRPSTAQSRRQGQGGGGLAP